MRTDNITHPPRRLTMTRDANSRYRISHEGTEVALVLRRKDGLWVGWKLDKHGSVRPHSDRIANSFRTAALKVLRFDLYVGDVQDWGTCHVRRVQVEGSWILVVDTGMSPDMLFLDDIPQEPNSKLSAEIRAAVRATKKEK